MRDKYLSVDEALIKTGQTCKVCNSQIRLVPDKEGAVHYFKHFNLTNGSKAFTIGFSIILEKSGLCYYHRKKKNGLLDTEALYRAKQEAYCEMIRRR